MLLYTRRVCSREGSIVAGLSLAAAVDKNPETCVRERWRREVATKESSRTNATVSAVCVAV